MDGEERQFSDVPNEPVRDEQLAPPATAPAPAIAIGLLVRILAGIESGIWGAFLMSGWMCAHSWWSGDRFLTPANIWATTLFGSSVMRWAPSRPLSGFALQFTMACIVGVFYALVAAGWKRFYVAFLFGLAVGALWYFLLVYWNRWIAVYSPQPETFIAYLLFGIVLSRTPLRCIHLAGVLASPD